MHVYREEFIGLAEVILLNFPCRTLVLHRHCKASEAISWQNMNIANLHGRRLLRRSSSQ